MSSRKTQTRCAALVALMAVTLLGGCMQQDAPDPARLIPDWRTYYNRTVGVQFEYPYNLELKIVAREDEQLKLELQWIGRGTPVFKMETWNVDAISAVEIGQGTYTVGGETASRSTVEVAGEPVQITKVISDGRVFEFTGKGTTFDKILDSVEFISGEILVPGSQGAEGPTAR